MSERPAPPPIPWPTSPASPAPARPRAPRRSRPVLPPVPKPLALPSPPTRPGAEQRPPVPGGTGQPALPTGLAHTDEIAQPVQPAPATAAPDAGVVPLPGVLSSASLAEVLDVDPRDVDALADEHGLAHRVVFGERRYARADVLALLEQS